MNDLNAEENLPDLKVEIEPNTMMYLFTLSSHIVLVESTLDTPNTPAAL